MLTRYAWPPRTSEAILVNPLNVGIGIGHQRPSNGKTTFGRFLLFKRKNSYAAWNNAHMDRMIRELAIFRPVILEANPSLLAKLCRYAFESKQNVFQPV